MRRSKRELERGLEDLAGGSGDGDEVFVVSIGGEPGGVAGWMPLEEYERLAATLDADLAIDAPMTPAGRYR